MVHTKKLKRGFVVQSTQGLNLWFKTLLVVFSLSQTACKIETSIRDTYADRVAPDAAADLVWLDSSNNALTGQYHTQPSLKASWKPSTAGDFANQKIQLYSDANCSVASGSAVALSSTATSVYSMGAVADGTYSFRVFSVDRRGNQGGSACSNAMIVDTTAPTLAITVPANNAYINIASDNTNYKISGTCSEEGRTVTIKRAGNTTIGTATCQSGVFDSTIFDLSNTKVNSFSLSEITHSITASITDHAGNSATSTAITVTRDVTAPVNASSLGWVQTSPSSTGSIIASWTKSISTDLASQSIQFYTGASCNVVTGSATALSKTATSSAFTGADGQTYTYKITSIDNAGNPSTSACSSSILIDTTAPTVTITTADSWINSTNKNAYTVEGSCSDVGTGLGNSGKITVTLFDGTNSKTILPTCTANHYTATFDADSAPALEEGAANITITAAASDLAGNIGSAQRTVGKKTNLPNIAITGTSDPSWINLANVQNFFVSGTCSDVPDFVGFISVTIKDSAAPTNHVLTQNSVICVSTGPMAGTFSATFDARILEDTLSGATTGNITITATATDFSGNTATTNPITRKKDTVAPVLVITSPVSGNYVKANANVDVRFTLTEVNAKNNQTFAITYNNGSVSSSSTAAVSDGPLNNASFTKAITTPAGDNTPIEVGISYSDPAGNSVTASASYTTDASLPTVTALALTDGISNVTKNNIKVSLSASNAPSPITQFCLKYDTTTTPLETDSCWVSLTTPNASISLSGYDFQIGFVQATYTVYAWVKNQAGTISTLSSSGLGTLATDKFSVTYDPGYPPMITALSAANADSPVDPTSISNLQFATNGDLYVKWNASDMDDSGNGLDANPISIYYITNDSTTYVPFPSMENIANNPGSGCTLPPSGYTGCRKLTSPVAANTVFRVRVAAKDKNGTTVYYNSEPLNTSKLRIIAGNTEIGLGGSAKTALYTPFGSSADNSYLYHHHLAVSSDGKYFYIHPSFGLVWVDPATGNLKVFIPTTDQSSSDALTGSEVSSATLKKPIGITMDYQNRLLIFDHDRIRRVNLDTMKISTIIGGGTTDLSTTNSNSTIPNPLSVMLRVNEGHKPYAALTMIPLPNGDLLFNSPDANRLKLTDYKYVAASGGNPAFIEPINYVDHETPDDPKGMGSNPNFIWSGVDSDGLTTQTNSFALGFDPNSNSNPTYLLKGFMRWYVGDAYRMYARINYGSRVPNTFNYLSEGDHNLELLKAGSVFTGLDGKIYYVNRYRNGLFIYNPTSNDFTIKIKSGAPSGLCDDGTLAINCAVDLESVFVSRTGNIYFADQGVIRTINAAGEVITVFGQFPSYNGGGVVAAANARFGMIMDLKLDRSVASSNNRVVVLDSFSNSYREVIRNGNVTDMTTAHFAWHGPWKFELHPTTGDIFSPVGHSNEENKIMKFVKGVGAIPSAWSLVIGRGATPYSTGDNKLGSEIKFNSPYNVSIVGLANNQLFYNKHTWLAPNNIDCMVKKYDLQDNFRQSHFIGDSTCSDSWKDRSPSISSSTSIYTNATRVEYVPSLSKYLVLRAGLSLGSNGSPIYSTDGNGTFNLETTLPNGINTFTHTYDAANGLRFYYCLGGYDIYRYTPLTNTLETFSLGINGMVCTANSTLNYVSNTNSIIFSYAQNGLYGVAEYFLNP